MCEEPSSEARTTGGYPGWHACSGGQGWTRAETNNRAAAPDAAAPVREVVDHDREFVVVLRERLASALREAPDADTAATLRLVMAALKERDHCAREAGTAEELDDGSIEAMLHDMVTQRQDEILRCEERARLEEAEQEAAEIGVLKQFLPRRMNESEVDAAVDGMIDEVGAKRLKDTGKVIAALKERYNGEMDFARAKRRVCTRLA